jgi:hypothetical protein
MSFWWKADSDYKTDWLFGNHNPIKFHHPEFKKITGAWNDFGIQYSSE